MTLGVLGLIVTCEECSTSFQLDEARIPASGAQVRCSRCKHAFFLPNPSASASEAADSIAEEAARDTMSDVPQATSETPAALNEATNTAADSLDAEPEEEDWQFSEVIRNEGDDEPETESDFEDGEAFEDLSDLGDRADEQGPADLDSADSVDSTEAIETFGGGSMSESGLELESDSEEAEPESEESDFGSVEDFSSLSEEEELAPTELDAGDGLEREQAESIPEGAGVYSSSGASDDLGDPESWDLVGTQDAAVSKVAIGSVATSTRTDFLADGSATENESAPIDYEEEIGPVSPIWQKLARAGHIAGWATTAVMVVAAFGVMFHSEWSRSLQTPQTVSAGPMTAETTIASWVETSRAGFVLVVRGQLHNTGSVPLRPGLLQLAILDAAGGRIAEPPIPVGERIPESILREASPDQLAASVAASISSFRDTPLAPGERRDFEAIAREADLPEDARRILLEIGDSAIVVEPAAFAVEAFAVPVQPSAFEVEPSSGIEAERSAIEVEPSAFEEEPSAIENESSASENKPSESRQLDEESDFLP